jgi:hypothetical protein
MGTVSLRSCARLSSVRPWMRWRRGGTQCCECACCESLPCGEWLLRGVSCSGTTLEPFHSHSGTAVRTASRVGRSQVDLIMVQSGQCPRSRPHRPLTACERHGQFPPVLTKISAFSILNRLIVDMADGRGAGVHGQAGAQMRADEVPSFG